MRRIVVAGVVGVTAALLLAPGAGAEVKGFRFSVAAGEIGPHSAHIWGATRGSGRVVAVVATDRRFDRVVFRRHLRAKGSNNNTVQTKVRALDVDRKHFYRFCARGVACSRTGKFRTAPRNKAPETIRFAYTGDTDGTRLPGADKPFFGTFQAFRTMRQEKNDFNIHLGDTIYSDSGVGGRPPALRTKQKWRKYRENLSQPKLARLRRSAAFYSHWDDHEFINDFSIPEDGERLYRAGVRAFRDYAPVTYSRKDGLYRTARWGKNLELFFLDERSFRSAKADFKGTCDNPDTNSPDLAPTAPQNVRDAFSVLIPSLANPVSNACTNAINDPNRTLLGSRQFNRFVRQVAESSARWKVIVNETPIQQFYGLPYDRWEGYAHERIRLLQELQRRGVANLVFLTTDTHAAFANVIRERTLVGDVAPANASAGTPPIGTPYQDFIIGPVATNTFWAEIDDVTEGEGNGELLSNAFFKPQPPNGIGMQCAQGDTYSYAEVTAAKKKIVIEYKNENGDLVIDVNGEPCGPYTITPFAP